MLQVSDATVAYPTSDGKFVQALDRVSLDMPPDSIVVAVGASGCGKSTLLNAIAGFLPLTHGSIKLDGSAISGPGGDRGVVFQKDTLLPWLSVLDNVALGLKYRGVARRERRERARVHDGAEGRLIVGRIAGALLDRRDLDGAVPLDLEVQERSLTGFAQPVLAIPLDLDFLDHLSHIPGVREVRSIHGERACADG